MIDEISEIFREIVKIPHCSGKTDALRAYIERKCQEAGYAASIDEAGNVMARAPKSRLTLQAHYDMVCVGSAPKIEPVIENGWMRAPGSSLGADNGMGVAIMLYLMRRGVAADFLFTNDEEIGLIGANRLKLEIRTPYMLNLDSEELGKIYIGCAGGEDLFVTRPLDSMEVPKEGRWYRLAAHAPGGHSGVNIADGIPNAISLLARSLWKTKGARIHSFKGGERINAIPRSAEAVIVMPRGEVPDIGDASIECEEIEPLEPTVMAQDRTMVSAIFGFAHGLRGWNRELGIPQTSINLATVEADAKKGGIDISLSGRAMDNDDLEALNDQTMAGFEALGFSGRREGKYPAWKPEVNVFSEKVRDIYGKFYEKPEYAAIHAGLECALFAAKFPDLKIASIGPTILYPHSDRERVDLASVETITKIVEAIVADLSPI